VLIAIKAAVLLVLDAGGRHSAALFRRRAEPPHTSYRIEVNLQVKPD